MPKWFRRSLIWLAAILLVGRFTTGLMSPGWFSQRPTSVTAQARERYLGHVAWAGSRAEELLEQRLSMCRRQITDRQKQCDAFADDMLGWSAKMTLAKESVGIGSEGAHADFVRQAFLRQVLSSGEVNQLIEQCIAGFQSDLLATQNELYVRLRHDVQDESLKSQVAEPLSQEIVQQLEVVLSKQRAASITASQQEIAGFIASTIAAEILTPVAVEVLASAGLLTAGAVSAPETLGVGLVVAIGVDMAYSRIADPSGRLSAKLMQELRSLATTLVDGQPSSPSLRAHLQQMLAEQVQRNQLALEQLGGAQ